MALYRNQQNYSENRNEISPEQGESPSVPPAKMDEMLLEALEAVEQARRLHESTPNPETKRQTKRILDSLHSSLRKLAPRFVTWGDGSTDEMCLGLMIWAPAA